MLSLKKCVALALLSVFTSEAFSAPLAAYRQCNNNQDENAKALQRSIQIRKNLNGDNQSSLNLNLSGIVKADGKELERRESFSNLYRSVIQEGVEAMYLELRHGTQSAFNPADSVSEYRQKQFLIRQKMIISGFNNRNHTMIETSADGKAKLKLTGLNAVVHELLGMVVLNAKAKNGSKEIFASNKKIPVEQLALRNQLETYMNNGPRAVNNKSIQDILGKIHDVEVRDQQLDEIHFSHAKDRTTYSGTIKDEDKISLSLDMLLSARTGRDDAYVETQRILFQYFTLQNEVFTRRKSELDRKIQADAISAILKMSSPVNYYGVTVYNTIISYAKSLFGDSAENEIQKAFTDKTRLDPKVSYAKNLEYLLEGQAKPGSKTEYAFISHRLSELAAVIHYVEAKFKGSLYAHRMMTSLSTQQANYLIDLFLQAKKSEIMTREESTKLNQYFSDSKNCVKTKSTVVDYKYFQNTSFLLNELEKSIDFERRVALGQVEDLNLIHKNN